METKKLSNAEVTNVCEQQQKRQDSTLEETLDVLKYAKYFIRSLLVLLVAWVFGCCGLSFAWILFGGLLYSVWYAQRKQKSKRRAIMESVIRNERDTILATLEDLPSWVFFPDSEKAEWVNKIMYQAWPFVTGIVEKTLRETIQPEINKNVPSSLKGIKFDVISLGDLPPRVGGVKAHVSKVRRSEVVLDLDIIYAGDAKITLIAKGLTAGIEDLQIRGTLRVVLYPLVSQVPLIGGITLYFVNRPKVDFDLTNALNVLDMPGINMLLRSIVSDTIAQFVVLPNKITVPLAEDVKSEQLKNRLPDGLLRIKVVEGKQLQAEDFNFVGKPTSDPYVKITVGAEKFKTAVKNGTLNPIWNEIFEVFIDEWQSREVAFHVYDEDLPSKDEILGKTKIKLANVLEEGYKNLWVPLEKAKSGQIHLQFTWLKFTNDPDDIKTALPLTPTKKNTIAKSALIVYIDSARDLPTSGGHSSCNPACKISVGNTKFETFHLFDTINPIWEQAFRFLVYSPEYQEVKFKVFDHKKDKTLGTFDFKIGNLLNAADMSVEEPFPLQNSSHNATMTVKFTLKGLVAENLIATDEKDNAGVIEENHAETPDNNDVTNDDKKFKADINENTIKSDEIMENGDVNLEKEGTSKQKHPKTEENHNNLSRTPSSKSDGESAQGKSRFDSLKKKARLFSSTAALTDEFHPTSPQGEVRLGISYNEDKQRLVIAVDQARDLLPSDEKPNKNNLVSIKPYVRIYLLPDKSRSTRLTTDVVKHTSNPIFSETLWYSVEDMESCKSRKLDIVVKTETPILKKAKGVKYNICRTVIDLAKENLSDDTPVWYGLYKIEED